MFVDLGLMYLLYLVCILYLLISLRFLLRSPLYIHPHVTYFFDLRHRIVANSTGPSGGRPARSIVLSETRRRLVV